MPSSSEAVGQAKTTPSVEADSAPLWKRLAWMLLIWAVSIAALGVVAYGIRFWLKG